MVNFLIEFIRNFGIGVIVLLCFFFFVCLGQAIYLSAPFTVYLLGAVCLIAVLGWLLTWLMDHRCGIK